MRERVTFVHNPEQPFDPKNLRVEKNGVEVKNLRAAREDKITIAYDELPSKVQEILKQCHEIHIRWVSPTYYESRAPFNARLSPGLHVSYTPMKGQNTDRICKALKQIFGVSLRCESPEISFTPAPILSGRFANTAASNYHDNVKWPNRMISWASDNVCAKESVHCLHKVNQLSRADYFDIDYDTISQALVGKVFRQETGEKRKVWNELITPAGDYRLEVGVLTNEKPSIGDTESLKMSGFLTVVGEDTKPNPTLFEFPARHHQSTSSSGSSYRASFSQPQGLHPTLELHLDPISSPPVDGCSLHTYVTLPSALFVDKYQYSSPMFRAAQNLGSIRALSGETDLEAPDWAVKHWGSLLLIELSPPTSASTTQWTAQLPLHLRYLPPIRSGKQKVAAPWPVVFWACHADEGPKMNTNPFDRTDNGYEGLFGPKTMFYHLKPNETAAGGLVNIVDVPTVDTEHTWMVGVVTFLVIVVGWLWVLAKVLRVILSEPKKETDKKKQ